MTCRLSPVVYFATSWPTLFAIGLCLSSLLLLRVDRAQAEEAVATTTDDHGTARKVATENTKPNDVDAALAKLAALGAEVQCLRGVPRIVSLRAPNVKVEAIAEILELVDQVDTLHDLHISELTPSTADFRRLASLRTPRLWLYSVELTAERIETLGDSSKLEVLTLNCCRFRDDVLPTFGKLQRLTCLDLASNDHLDGELFVVLATLPKLTQLRVVDRKLTDENLLGLRHLDSLQRLDIDGGEVTDAVFAELEAKPNLKYLDLRGEKITVAAAQVFRARHPRIYFSTMPQEDRGR